MQKVSYTIENLSVGNLLSKLSSNHISIPKFQRRDNLWSSAKKSAYILSVMFYFTPAIILGRTKGVEPKFYLIDGLQRISALASFVSDGYKLNIQENFIDIHDENIVNIVNEINGKKFSELPEIYKNLLLTAKIPSVILDIPDEYNSFEKISYIFKILNINPTPLNKSELRYAIYYNEMFSYILNRIEEERKTLKHVFLMNLPHKRMKDFDVFLRIYGVAYFTDEMHEKYVNDDDFKTLTAFMIYNNFMDEGMKDIVKEGIDFTFEKLLEYGDWIKTKNVNIKEMFKNSNTTIYDILGFAINKNMDIKGFEKFINILSEREDFVGDTHDINKYENVIKRFDIMHEVFTNNWDDDSFVSEDE
ncbi:MAG: DUF262 domain-containing protein [Nanopusillaceae archaeon]